MNNKHVFLSYSSKNADLCDAVYKYLWERDVHCWRFDYRNEVGDNWLKEINNAISRSSAIVAIVSPSYIASDMCCMEFNNALKQGIKVYPMRCDGLEVAEIPSEWSHIVFQELNASSDTSNIAKLHQILKGDRVVVPVPRIMLRVTRGKTMTGQGNPFTLYCDGRELGTIGNDSWLEREIPPGEHIMQARYSIYYWHAGPRYSRDGYAKGESPEVKVSFKLGQKYEFETGYVGGWEGFLDGWRKCKKLFLRPVLM